MNKEKKNLLFFGYGLAIILTIVAIRLWIKYHWVLLPAGLISFASFLAVLTFSHYLALREFYAGWMKVARLIGSVISTVFLSMLFFFLFAPAGIVLRLLKKDLLEETIDREKESYWKTLPAPAEGKERYLKQY
jgi:hypothetical protein